MSTIKLHHVFRLDILNMHGSRSALHYFVILVDTTFCLSFSGSWYTLNLSGFFFVFVHLFSVL